MKTKSIIFSILLAVAALQINAQYYAADVTALMAIKASCDAGGNLNWTSSDSDEITWEGVTWSSTAPKRVRALNVSNKSLTSEMDVRALGHLQILNCNDNQLTKLLVSEMDSINNLQCSGNKLTELDLSNLTSLTSLYCLNNEITEITFAGVDKLKDFHCSGNKLTALNLTGILDNSYKVKCDSNELSSLIFPVGISGSLIYCFENRLPFSVLYTLPFSEGQILPQKEVFETSFYKTNVTLDYSSEAVVKGDYTTTFTFYKNGEQVTGNGTGIYTTNGDGTYYCKMVNKGFYGSDNSITSAPVYVGEAFQQSDLDALKNIDNECDVENKLNWNTSNNPLGWDGVTWLQPKESLKRVNAVNVKSKSLKGKLNVTNLSELEQLDCSDNKISGLDVTGLAKLEVLKCSNNPIPLSSLATALDIDDFEFTEEVTILEPETIYGFQELDYSSEALINGVPTEFVFYKDGEVVETNSTGKYTPTELGVYNCSMTNAELSGVVQTTAAVTVYEPTSVNDEQSTNGIFYPNPAQSRIYFTNPGDITEVSLYSVNGAELLKSTIIEGGLDISKLESGMYILKIKRDGIFYTQKLIIK